MRKLLLDLETVTVAMESISLELEGKRLIVPIIHGLLRWPLVPGPLWLLKSNTSPPHICYFSNSQCLRNNQVRPMAGSKDLYSRLLPACYFFSPHSFQESQNACYLKSSTKEEFRLLSLRSHWRAGAATCRQWLCKELFCSSITDDTHVWFPGKPRYLMTPPWCCAPAE